MNLINETVFRAVYGCISREVERYLIADTFEEALEMAHTFESTCGKLKSVAKWYSQVYRKPTKTITVEI